MESSSIDRIALDIDRTDFSAMMAELEKMPSVKSGTSRIEFSEAQEQIIREGYKRGVNKEDLAALIGVGYSTLRRRAKEMGL